MLHLVDAFEPARRHLEVNVCRRRHHVKEHSHSLTGPMGQLLPEKRLRIHHNTEYAEKFISMRMQLLTRFFSLLKLGSEVTFTEEQADKGDQTQVSLKVVQGTRRRVQLAG